MRCLRSIGSTSLIGCDEVAVKSILFFSRFYVGGSCDNLSAKFQGQVSAAQRMGLDAWYVGIDGDTVSLYNCDRKYRLAQLKTLLIPTISQVIFYEQFYRSILKLVRIRSQFDYVYARSIFGIRYGGESVESPEKNGG